MPGTFAAAAAQSAGSVPSFIAALLNMGAAYLEQAKPMLVANWTTPVDAGIDTVIGDLKKAVGHSFIAGFIDTALDNLDATEKANVPTEIGALIDFLVNALNKLAGG